MVNPFFSGEVQQGSESDGGLDDFEIYHRLLLAYPAYTIDRIETELSWRQVKLMLSCWKDNPPTVMIIAKVENMLEKKFGFKSIATIKTLNGDDLINHLEGQGLL